MATTNRISDATSNFPHPDFRKSEIKTFRTSVLPTTNRISDASPNFPTEFRKSEVSRSKDFKGQSWCRRIEKLAKVRIHIRISIHPNFSRSRHFSERRSWQRRIEYPTQVRIFRIRILIHPNFSRARHFSERRSWKRRIEYPTQVRIFRKILRNKKIRIFDKKAKKNIKIPGIFSVSGVIFYYRKTFRLL